MPFSALSQSMLSNKTTFSCIIPTLLHLHAPLIPIGQSKQEANQLCIISSQPSISKPFSFIYGAEKEISKQTNSQQMLLTKIDVKNHAERGHKLK